MGKTILLIGGCRSGKSRHALEIAGQMSGINKIFIATCVPEDEEMRQRIANHQKERGSDWITVEVPVLLPEKLVESSKRADIILVDCLTLWISNLLLQDDNSEVISKHIQKLTSSLSKLQCTVILVSNEVGAGIVPENELARKFRDLSGFVNQDVAVCSDEVIWMVAGIPVPIKS